MVIGLFHKYLDLGMSGKSDPHEIRKIRTANLLNLVVALYLLISYTKYFILQEQFSPWPSTVFLAGSLIAFILAILKKQPASFFVFTWNINLAVLFFNLYYPLQSGAYLYYFPLAVSIILLNIPYIRNAQSLLYLAVFLLCFAARFLVVIPGLQMTSLSESQIHAIWYYDIVLSVLVTVVLGFLLAQVIMDQNREITVQNAGLKRAKASLAVALKEKEILLAELNHRIKNNFAIISSLLNLQIDSLESEEARTVVSDNRNRIQSMALVHHMLYDAPLLKSVDIGKYSSSLIRELFYSYNMQQIKLNQEYDRIPLPVEKSIPVGLIINEFVTNSVKHVYKDSLDGAANFSLRIRSNGDNMIHFMLKDSGHGFPDDFGTGSQSKSLGVSLIRTLAEQLDGEVKFSNDNGARLDLAIPVVPVAI
jgi:two-component sensor histidine kinase